ncbi:DUF5590 domain-containing protein [Streptococcus suis]|nr:DUF5590 domain-containing protein [Streptococcus suis]
MEKKFNRLVAFASSRIGQFLIGFFVLLSCVVFSVFYVWDRSLSPFEQARVEAQQIAQQYADVSQVDDFAIYNGTETYYSLTGKDKNGDEVYVLIPSASSSIYVYPVGAGITKEEAQAIAQENGAKTADRIILGYRDGKPIWEVKSGTAYYLVDFETGDFVKMEGL